MKELQEFERAMDDDLNTPRALAAVHRTARAVNRAIDQGELSKKDVTAVLRLFSRLDNVLGILTDRTRPQELPKEAERLIGERDQARANRDWATADKLREELYAMGIIVEDTPAGTAWKRKR